MFSNRFTGTFDWYQRNTNGMLAPGVQLPAVVGADAPYQNTADMRTRGWELSFNWRDQIGKVSYRVGFNLSDSKSKIVKYDSNSSYILSSQKTNALTGETYTFWEFYKGKELGEIWGYETDGYYTVDDFVDTSSWKLKDGVPSIDGYNPRPGDVKFKNLMDDERGTNMISSGNNTLNNPGDRKVIGNETPRYLYGINLGLNYKGFDLSAFLQGTGKRDKWIANTLTFPLYSDFKFIPLYKGLGDYWQPVDAANGDYTAVNPNAEFPRIYGNYGNQVLVRCFLSAYQECYFVIYIPQSMDYQNIFVAVTCFCQCRKSGNALIIAKGYRPGNAEMGLSRIPHSILWA